MAAAGITGDAAKQMMAAVKGGGRKYFYFVSFGKKTMFTGYCLPASGNNFSIQRISIGF